MRRPTNATVVLPAYRGSAGLPKIVEDLAVAAYALRSRGIVLDVLLVDGRADAETAAARRRAEELGLPLRLLDDPPAGSGAAYVAGFRRVVADGRADLVVTLDANGRHDATQIPRLVDELLARDWHVIIGSRWAPGSGTPGLEPSRWLLGRLANLAFRWLTGTRGISDATTSFRVARIDVVRAFQPPGADLNSHSVQTAFVAAAKARGFRVGEGAIIYRLPNEPGGELQPGDALTFARHLWRTRGRAEQLRGRRLSRAGRVFDDDHFGAADDLERLGTARFFFDWVLDGFDPDIRGRVLEVGAGVGTITRKLLERYPDISVVALEPADNLYDELHAVTALSDRVEARRQTLAEYAAEAGRFDTVIYLNVLEHIADDEAEVRGAARLLNPGGALLVFGPALEWLYSELDHKAGHYRRYSVGQLRRLADAAGLEVVSAHYLDVMGVLPYLVVYRLLRRTEITGSTMWGYDRLVVPFSRTVQRLVGSPPLGKNAVLVARKPQ